jgi:hypothetical protein
VTMPRPQRPRPTSMDHPRPYLRSDAEATIQAREDAAVASGRHLRGLKHTTAGAPSARAGPRRRPGEHRPRGMALPPADAGEAPCCRCHHRRGTGKANRDLNHRGTGRDAAARGSRPRGARRLPLGTGRAAVGDAVRVGCAADGWCHGIGGMWRVVLRCTGGKGRGQKERRGGRRNELGYTV